jgi:hypothetical protein
MSAQKHTQGPWKSNYPRITSQGSMALTVAVVLSREDNKARIDSAAKTKDEAMANAQLIASAPDLLTQLQSIRVELEAQALGYTAIEIWPHVRAEMIRRILLTIAKVEGVK